MEGQAGAKIFGKGTATTFHRLECGRAVDMWFAYSKKIEVRSIQQHQAHGYVLVLARLVATNSRRFDSGVIVAQGVPVRSKLRRPPHRSGVRQFPTRSAVHTKSKFRTASIRFCCRVRKGQFIMLNPKPLASRQGGATRSELLRKIGPGAIDQTASKGASCPTSWKAGPALSDSHRQGHDNRCPAHALATGEPASIAASPATLRRSL